MAQVAHTGQVAHVIHNAEQSIAKNFHCESAYKHLSHIQANDLDLIYHCTSNASDGTLTLIQIFQLLSIIIQLPGVHVLVIHRQFILRFWLAL